MQPVRRRLHVRPSFAQRGFSLLEVLVAFSIMALALGALYQAVGGSVRGMSRAEMQSRAAMTAESILSAYSAVPAGGLSDGGRLPDGMAWRISAEPYPLPETSSNGWRLYLVRVDVEWEGGGVAGPGHFGLVSLLPERRETQ